MLTPLRALVFWLILGTLLASDAIAADASREKRYLYVAVPGVRNYLEYGGHGVLVFDIDDGHKFVKRIKTQGLAPNGKPSNVKGVCASARTGRLYISTLDKLQCLDLASEKVLWERAYEGGCDRMSIAPDGSYIYLPSLEKNHWHVIDAKTGDVIAKITPNSGAHNTIVGLNGKEAYLAGLRSPLLTIADTSKHEAVRTCGPFSGPVRPFTVNAKQTRVYACINGLLGFEVGDLASGKMLHRVEVQGYKQGKIKRHGCPSHGVGLTPDEKEIWVSDAANQRVHIFDNTVEPPKQVTSIQLRDEPGWVTFSLDGKYAYPSTGEVIDPKTKQILTALKDETGAAVMSEKMLEIVFADGKPIRNGDQFGLGRAK